MRKDRDEEDSLRMLQCCTDHGCTRTEQDLMSVTPSTPTPSSVIPCILSTVFTRMSVCLSSLSVQENALWEPCGMGRAI
eukprot:gene8940-6272_t